MCNSAACACAWWQHAWGKGGAMHRAWLGCPLHALHVGNSSVLCAGRRWLLTWGVHLARCLICMHQRHQAGGFTARACVNAVVKVQQGQVPCASHHKRQSSKVVMLCGKTNNGKQGLRRMCIRHACTCAASLPHVLASMRTLTDVVNTRQASR